MNSYTNQQNAYRKASVNTLDQNKLIVMLYDGAIKQAGFACLLYTSDAADE